MKKSFQFDLLKSKLFCLVIWHIVFWFYQPEIETEHRNLSIIGTKALIGWFENSNLSSWQLTWREALVITKIQKAEKILKSWIDFFLLSKDKTDLIEGWAMEFSKVIKMTWRLEPFTESPVRSPRSERGRETPNMPKKGQVGRVGTITQLRSFWIVKLIVSAQKSYL